jgi:uncharacterized membrane protein
MVRAVRGVRGVENQLEAHTQPGQVPGLQGGKAVARRKFELAQRNWAPGPRVLAGGAGAAALALMWRQPPLTLALGLAGGGMLLRAVTNRPIWRALGFAGGRGAIEVQKTIEVNAPVERVFELWSDPRNFPRIMSHVREVKKTDGLYHWTVAGPAGASISWTAAITEFIPRQMIAWKSVPGSALENAGIVRFDATRNGGTRIQIRLSYNPPGGELGRAFAALLGAQPKRLLDDDLVRLKSLLEHGKTTAHGHTTSATEITGLHAPLEGAGGL